MTAGIRSLVVFHLILLTLATSACIRRVEQPRSQKTSEAAEQLAEMVRVDQELRLNDTLDCSVVAEASRRHRAAVYELLARSAIAEPQDLFNAALLLQHADPNSCRECYLLAHHLARQAADLGYNPARYLSAATLDLYLVFGNQPQKYGTQYNVDSLGRHYLFPVDDLTSDSERAVWDVPPLDSLKVRVERLNAGK
ncbi:MAG: hypothetical protein AB1744_10380 [Candidatus Zixiibacteriota bacterium]